MGAFSNISLTNSPVKQTRLEPQTQNQDKASKVGSQDASRKIKRRSRPHVAPEEIREKIRQNKESQKVEISDKARKLNKMNPKDNEKKPIEVKGDIGLNDPSDPNTKDRLKLALNSGMVNFSPKEREVLSKIINDKA